MAYAGADLFDGNNCGYDPAFYNYPQLNHNPTHLSNHSGRRQPMIYPYERILSGYSSHGHYPHGPPTYASFSNYPYGTQSYPPYNFQRVGRNPDESTVSFSDTESDSSIICFGNAPNRYLEGPKDLAGLRKFDINFEKHIYPHATKFITRKKLIRLMLTYNNSISNEEQHIHFHSPTEDDLAFATALRQLDNDKNDFAAATNKYYTLRAKYYYAKVEEQFNDGMGDGRERLSLVRTLLNAERKMYKTRNDLLKKALRSESLSFVEFEEILKASGGSWVMKTIEKLLQEAETTYKKYLDFMKSKKDNAATSETNRDRSLNDDCWLLKSQHQVPQLMHLMADFYLQDKEIDNDIRATLEGILGYAKGGDSRLLRQHRDWQVNSVHKSTQLHAKSGFGLTCSNEERLLEVAAEYFTSVMYEHSTIDTDIEDLAKKLLARKKSEVKGKIVEANKAMLKAQFAIRNSTWLFQEELKEGINKTLATWIINFENLMEHQRGSRKQFYAPFVPFSDVEKMNSQQLYIASQIHRYGRAWVDAGGPEISQGLVECNVALRGMLKQQLLNTSQTDTHDCGAERRGCEHDHPNDSRDLDEDIPVLVEAEDWEGAVATALDEVDRDTVEGSQGL